MKLDGFKYLALNVEKVQPWSNFINKLALSPFHKSSLQKYSDVLFQKLPPVVSPSKRPHIGPRSVKRGRSCALNQISIHTLLAFGQFLRLPEYRINPDTKAVLQSIIGLGKETNFSSG
mgnify:CR=1 FL=1